VEEPQMIGDDLQAILNSITYTLPTLTPPNVDPPLPEDGSPYVPAPTTLLLGKLKITAAWLGSDQSIVVDSRYDNQIAMSGDKLYVLAGDKLYEYLLTDAKTGSGAISYSDVMKLDDKYEYMSNTKDGTMYLSQGIFNIIAIRDGSDAVVSDISGDVVMHPDGEWGISFWANSDPLIVKSANGTLTSEPWILANLSDDTLRKGRFSSISCISISQDRIYVAGNDVENGGTQRLAVYDLKGKELFTVGSNDWTADDGFSSITGIVETSKGFLVLDSNNRALKLFDKKGKFQGTADCDQLFGTNAAWLSCMIPAEDGVLVAATQTRQDESADELLVFHVTGF
jgi:hypothetical protein